MIDPIDRQAAIETLDRFNVFGYVEEPWEKLSGALQALPSAQPEITEDDVKEYCRKRCLIVVTSDFYEEMMKRWSQSERKKGKWIPVTNGRGGHECSLCHSYAPSFQAGDEWLTDYCPCCGADMREGDKA